MTCFCHIEMLHNLLCNMLCKMLYRYKQNLHPRGYDHTPPAGGPQPRAGDSAAYACRRRHPLTHLYAKRSQLLGSWAGHSPPQAGPARRATTDRRMDRLGRGPGRPVQFYVREREIKRRVKGPVKLKAPDRGRGRVRWRSRRRAENRRGKRRRRVSGIVDSTPY